MAKTPSTMMPLGTIAPAFALPDASTGQVCSLDQCRSDTATVLMFICNHCPYVKHVLPALLPMAREYGEKGIAFVAISSNDAERYPDDGPAAMSALAAALRFPFPYLYDESQAVARAYDAACTPDFFVFDGALRCVYRGRFDGSTPGNGVPLSGSELRAALDAVLAGVAPAAEQSPSVGCNIKWKVA